MGRFNYENYEDEMTLDEFHDAVDDYYDDLYHEERERQNA